MQRVDFKVHVNCCDGCKRKVKKALDIKGNFSMFFCVAGLGTKLLILRLLTIISYMFNSGVLRIEIHQSLPKLTVIGNFDVRILLKRLAKVGKTAEIIPAEETKKPQKEETKKSNDSSEKEKSKEETTPKDKSKPEDAEKSKETKNEEKDDKKPKNKEESKETKENKDRSNIQPMVVSAIPSYTINPSIVSSNAPPVNYQMVPMPCYTMNNPYPGPIPSDTINPSIVSSNAPLVNYQMVPMPCYHGPIPYGYRENGYYEAPLNRRIPPPVHSQATVFTEYFNEDNTASCHVM
jgi:Skp family chaperone for outer membrane proteins